MSWLQHWDLHFDPFRPGMVRFVPCPGHEEAVARLVHCVENAEARAELRGPADLGKSAVLEEALRRLRRPARLLCPVRLPADGLALLSGVGERLGVRIPPSSSPSEAIARLLDAARVARAQGIGLVIAVDGDQLLDTPEDQRQIDRVAAVARQAGARCSVFVAGRGMIRNGGGSIAIRIDRLTRDEAARYLDRKLVAAGRSLPTFADPAVLRLHVLSEGLPGAIDRLAGLALRAAALSRAKVVETVHVEGVARELEPPGEPIGARPDVSFPRAFGRR
ncbi:hypothetical protein [Tautonia sociabilis]|uniref:ATP-binding protein n=1 Tax=Tautonia sociabilis TaxID=2080755 RepID=A0A432MQL0_9BACT|nr:hypothetical protein [Tautonia sociabilis]RUL89539.1 hypothetical protein TsocGM_01850 [Tautonia sociabilis]